MISEVISKKVLTHHDKGFPTNWDVNPYRGCTIGCKYCFAQYSHKYLGLEDFSKDILVKTNVSECLEKELNKKSWKREQIKIGGTTDLYQHSEKKYELLPKIFDVVKKHRTPIFIQTKSILILRDYEIIKELSKITTVDIATSISTFDESIRKVIEPGAASAIERLEMLQTFSKICHSTTVGFMPIIPILSDTDENLDSAFRLTNEFRLDNIVTSFLFMRGDLKPKFLNTIKSHFPEIYSEFSKLYVGSNLDLSYIKTTNLKLEVLRQKYKLYGVFKPVKLSEPSIQLSLF
jgi:DNA repair photolyase